MKRGAWVLACAVVAWAHVAQGAMCYSHAIQAWIDDGCTLAAGAILAAQDDTSALFVVPEKSFALAANSLTADGTQCTAPADRTINGGPKVPTVNCADNDGSRVDWNVVMPDSYDGSTITIELAAENENAAPSGDLVVDWACQCRGTGTTVNNTWGTSQATTSTFSGQYGEVHATTAALTPNGTCAGGVHLFCKGVVNATSSTTQVANVYWTQVKVEYGVSAATD